MMVRERVKRTLNTRMRLLSHSDHCCCTVCAILSILV